MVWEFLDHEALVMIIVMELVAMKTDDCYHTPMQYRLVLSGRSVDPTSRTFLSLLLPTVSINTTRCLVRSGFFPRTCFRLVRQHMHLQQISIIFSLLK